jgi:acetoin utilization deacetylase AcuC-like enzyme
MVLINPGSGLLTHSSEFTLHCNIVSSVEKAKLSDVLRVHDYNYLKRVIEAVGKLGSADEKAHIRFGKYLKISLKKNYLIDRDSVVSKKTWEASLLSCGTVI